MTPNELAEQIARAGGQPDRVIVHPSNASALSGAGLELEVELATCTDSHNFSIGMQMRFAMWRGQLVRERWYHRFAWHRIRRRLLWWRYPPAIVSHVDHEHGVVTLSPMRWSWRRWKWESA